MPEKDLNTYSMITYLWVTGLSMLGGFVSFARKVKEGKARAFNIIELIGEIITSAFTGIVTFFLCQAAGVGELWTIAFVGISGHMGTRAIFLMEKFFERRFGELK